MKIFAGHTADKMSSEVHINIFLFSQKVHILSARTRTKRSNQTKRKKDEKLEEKQCENRLKTYIYFVAAFYQLFLASSFRLLQCIRLIFYVNFKSFLFLFRYHIPTIHITVWLKKNMCVLFFFQSFFFILLFSLHIEMISITLL